MNQIAVGIFEAILGAGQVLELTGFSLKILTVALSTAIAIGLFIAGFRISATPSLCFNPVLQVRLSRR